MNNGNLKKIYYCPIKSLSFNELSLAKIDKNIGIINDRCFAFTRGLNLIQSNEAQKHFDATLMLDEYSLKQDFGKIMIRQPFITVKVVLGIYWQALKLWVKRSPFYDHPNTVTPNKAEIQSYDTD